MSLKNVAISEQKDTMLQPFSAIPVKIVDNLLELAQQNGMEKEREEIVCRLLASGMTVEEIVVVLCIRKETISIIEHNNNSIKIPEYAKKLKERRRRRDRQNKGSV